jgi:two-component system OmpR family sensor kinase
VRGSLRFRLAIWCAAIICGIVLMIALYGYAIASRTQYDDLDGRLQTVTNHVATELVRATSGEDQAHVLSNALGLGVEVALYDSVGAPLSVYARPSAASTSGYPRVDPRRVLLDTPSVPYGPLAALAPAIHPEGRGPGTLGLVETSPRRWRVYVLPVRGRIVIAGRAARYIVSLVSLTELDRALRRVLLLMIWLALVGNLLTFGTGWLLAGRALQPVLVLTEAAGSIARSGAFSQRVPAAVPRDELGRLATTFNEMLERLERVHAAQARFVSDASHELRAPLTVIQANLELLEHQRAMSPIERDEAVHEAHTEAARLGRLVADLLLLARADAGLPIRRAPVDLDQVLMEVIGEVRHLHPQREIAMSLEPVVVAGDADRLKQLLVNVVENAIKYTLPAGSVSVTLRRIGPNAEIEVRDAGIGISSDDLPRVFERFFRADRARTRMVGGTGLGLPIALLIARQHDGDLTLTSELGHGTTATVRLPVAS